jgi:hypothetical protein
MEIFFKKERGSKEAEKLWSIYPPKQEEQKMLPSPAPPWL